MARARLSMQELIRQRTRAGFVGRGDERAAFRENLDLPPEDERHRFLFHVHGNAGVGKTFLVRELEQIAREKGALTVYVDESVGSVPEAMSAISRQFAAQGHRFKELDRLLAAHRERRHEAEVLAVAPLDTEAQQPSAGGMAVARAGLVGLGMVPVVGAFAGALDADRLAQGADRLREGLSARFRSQEDVQLVLSPERVLTPVLLAELSEAAAAAPWIVLFLDTYERTGPFLDGWLHEVMTGDRYGTLPSTVVVVTSGQRPFDTARWGAFADFMTDLPLAPFTEAEARGLLADRGVVAEEVVAEVLRLTGGLPLLVSTLAEQRPTDPGDVGDLSATAVERYLKWEQDPVRQAVALACALPRRLDMDVFRATVDCPSEEADALFGWLRRLAFVDDRGDRLRYHDLVREPMLRLQRRRSPRGWTERHEALAAVFGGWREEAAQGLRPYEKWGEERWREPRLEEAYHLLCARPTVAFPGVLRDLIGVCGADPAAGRHFARMLQEAGAAAGAADLEDWGRRLGEALADDEAGTVRAMDLLLAHQGLRVRDRALAHTLRGIELRESGEYTDALVDLDQAIALDTELDIALYNRGVTRRGAGDFPGALTDFDRAEELSPDNARIKTARGETCRLMGRLEEAVADFDRAIALDPADDIALASRGVCRHALGEQDLALADFDRALRVDTDHVWALVRRARLHRDMGEWEKAFADLDRAVVLRPDSDWVASERGEAYRRAERWEEAVAELDRALSIRPDHVSAHAGRGYACHRLGRTEEALASLDRAVELAPDYTWALVTRARVKGESADRDGEIEDLRRAVSTDPGAGWAETELGETYRLAGRHQEAIAAFRQVIERDPDDVFALSRLGASYRALRNYSEALVYLDRALAVSSDYAWAYDQRARVHLAIGRVEQSLSDWDTRLSLGLSLGEDVDMARYKGIETLIRAGRWDEAAARLTAAFWMTGPDPDLDHLRLLVHRHNGQWEEARSLAERLRSEDALDGAFELAMIASGSQGQAAAEPHWREVVRLLDTEELDETERLAGRCVSSCGLADWAAADRYRAELLAAALDWDDLETLAALFTDLANSPGADRDRLAPHLTAITEARDALRARYAE
ncbi:tetratricopeptide repeat protein [Streptomyces sp. S.PB5]|nr:tetratricopeptide repeat protein [Streptomyces sp. S.PB5]MDN3023260.1 tetratricopeptide repeat protein [Streptomyces sp. S.PB5]